MSPVKVADARASAAEVHPPRKLGLSVVIPCFNEEAGAPALVARLEALERELAGERRVEFVFIDDGSTDATAACLETLSLGRENYRLLRHPQNRGIAAAMLTGIHAATYEYTATIDADCTYDPALLIAMLPQLEAGADVVTASPYHPAGEVLNVPAWRLTLSKTASRLYRWVFRRKLHTYTSCFRLLRQSVVGRLELRESGFVGVTEMLWRLDRNGCHIVEQPAVLSSRQFGVSKLRVVRATWGHVKLLTRAACERLLGR